MGTEKLIFMYSAKIIICSSDSSAKLAVTTRSSLVETQLFLNQVYKCVWFVQGIKVVISNISCKKRPALLNMRAQTILLVKVRRTCEVCMLEHSITSILNILFCFSLNRTLRNVYKFKQSVLQFSGNSRPLFDLESITQSKL